MACTQQSATEYLKHKRTDLVTHLQNFTLIVEKLYKCKVFNNHEVDALKAEKRDFNKARFILDCVTKKGERACYELLRILDKTRKRTLNPKSHIWITCFPFREDIETDYNVGTKPCHGYQKKLKEKAANISSRKWEQCCKHLKDKTSANFTFIPLVLDLDADFNSATNKIKIKNKKCKKLRPNKLKNYIPMQRQKPSPEDLLCSQEKSMLLIGKPGIGKTAVVQEMLSLWSKKDNRSLDYMFYFDESTFTNISSPTSLESLLFDMYLKPLEKERKEVLQDIEEISENVTIVFDGISTLEHNPIIKKIVERDLLPEAKIVITCRSEEEDDLLFAVHASTCKVYVHGFSKESIQMYFREILHPESDRLCIFLNSQELFSLCHVPMYAFVVAACVSFSSCTAPVSSNTVTEIYVHIFRQNLMKAGNKSCGQVDNYIKHKRDQLYHLMECAFNATKQKTVNLSNAECEENKISDVFLKKITIKESVTSVETFCAFLHNTIQEFFSALWLLGNPGEIDEVLQNCLSKKQKHMKHVIPFLCGLLSEQNLKLLKNLFTEDQIKRASNGIFTKVLNTFLQPQPNGQVGGDDDEVSVLLFVCQCLYESQSPEACLLFLEKMNYDLDLSGEDLDPHQCCAVSYVISQSREKQVHLSLEDCSVSDTGIQMILRFKSHFRDKPSTLCHVWRSVLCCEKPRDFTALLDICGKEMHLPVPGEAFMFRKAIEVMSQGSEKISLHLHYTENTQRFSDDLCNVVLKALPYVKSLSFSAPSNMEVSSSRLKMKSLLNICVHAALYKKENVQVVVPKVAVLSEHDSKDFLMDLYSYVKDYEAQTGSSVFPVLQPLYRSLPVWYTMSNVWSINITERKASHFLEALKVQTAKKPVNLWGWSDEESEVRSFLQCLPYISQLRVLWTGFYEEANKMSAIQFLLKLIVTAAECDAATGESFTKLLTSVCSYTNFPFGDDVSIKSSQCDFLLDLYSRVKDYETQTGRSVLPALQPVYQSAPAVWNIDLSERKTSLFLEVLKLQTVKKPVELRGWSDEESEVRSFLQCLPYISQLRFLSLHNQTESYKNKKRLFLLNLSLQAAVHQRDTVKRTIEELMSHTEDEEDFLLDLYSHVKDYETQTGRSVLTALQPVYQSAPAVWNIDLSKRKTSLFLEVLKLQTVKKPVELRGWSDEESEVRSFLQCLPYISQLRFEYDVLDDEEQRRSAVEFLLKLIVTAAECDAATGESFTKLLTSVCSYTTFPVDWTHYHQCDFLLDLCSRVKDYETQTGRSVLPALQPVYQSAPAVWYIDLSERKTSIFLEVLKLQTVKKPVKLRGWSDEESEVRSFLQCLPYISHLRFEGDVLHNKEQRRSAVEFLLKLIVTAAECDAATGESFTKLLTSVCSYTTFPVDGINYQCDFLLDLYSRVKDYETQTGRSVLPALQPVYQSAPAVWYIDLSERKTSLFLEVLKLHTVKKPVKLLDWSVEESEVRSFLQCLPYISQLRFHYNKEQRRSAVAFLLKLIVTAAECDAATGESFTKLLTSVCSYTSFPVYWNDYQCDFLLDLYSHVKDYETQTGRSVLPALQPVYQSAPAVWNIDLSERKTSLFLEVLKLHTVKKPVELRGWSDEESEVRSFLQCLPYISQLRFEGDVLKNKEQRRSAVEFLLKLIVTAAECDAATGESFTKLLTSVCSYKTFPVDETNHQSDFLLDLYSHLKDYKTQTGRSVLPELQPVYQSVPAVWNIDLSERKTSLFLEVLKLQTVKKPVELRGWSDEESEVRSFLQCLPYISHLRYEYHVLYNKEQRRSAVEFLLKLIVTAAECDAATGESFTKLLTSVCSYTNFPFGDDVSIKSSQCDFLLDLYSRVKDYETQTGRSVLPALQPVYQSAPAVWNIDLSERKTSLFLEVLKLQTVKKPVELRGWSDEESEVRSFLQCLPYISQLRFLSLHNQTESYKNKKRLFLLNLSLQAAVHQRDTVKRTIEELMSHTEDEEDFLLDLYSHVKDYETQTGRSVLTALQPVYQSAPAVWNIDLSKRKTSLFLEVLKLQTVKKPVELRGWSDEESEVRSFLQCLPYISQLRFEYDVLDDEEQRRSAVEFLLKLIVTAAECDAATGESFTKLLTSVCSYTTFPVDWTHYHQCDFLLDLCSRVKDYETQTGRSVLPALQPVYQSAPAVWYIDLSERKTSVFLEVLKLQTVKKPVKLRGWSDEESEVRSFLQCLPYISHLRFEGDVLHNKEQRRSAVEFLLKLIVTAAECDAATGESFTKLLTSVCSYTTFPVDGINYQCDFLLDLYSRVKDYETQTGRSVLPALQPVYQSAPAVWYIDLSERKTSLFLEVLKLHTVKKPVKLLDWSVEESEVRSFLQCLPYISQLRFHYNKEQRRSAVAFLLKLIVTAAECDAATGESFTKLLTSVCSYTSFPVYWNDYQCDFLLDLYSHVKDYETQTGRSVLPALQPVYQSAPAVWNIDLSERKTSLFLEVLKLHTVKKPVELRGWSDEESEVRSFLQCLPYISQLRFEGDVLKNKEQRRSAVEFLLKLIVTAAECDAATGESFTKLLTSVCSYKTFPVDETNHQSDFLLDLYSHLKDYKTQTGRSVLPELQPVYQSVPAVWNIDLSERKTSLFLEVLKLQTVKKPVELRGWSDEESEVRSFLQCLPYISQLRFEYHVLYNKEQRRSAVEFLLKLIVTAAECDAATGESFTKLLTSVYDYTTFPFGDDVSIKSSQCDFLLDLYSRVKDYETQTGRSVLPALQPVYQSAPAVWNIDLSERKTSLFLEVLKLLTVKKPVKLRGWSDEESEVRSFLQCLPYISQLRFEDDDLDDKEQRRSAVEFLLKLIVTAAECDAATGESFTKLLTSVCSYTNFPVEESGYYGLKANICDFLLDLYSRVKDYETQTGRSFLPALQPVYQSAPAVWNIDLSKRKTSLFLEVLKLHTVKKPVELRGWSDEESEVRSFLQCLPYISQLRFEYHVLYNKEQRRSTVEFLLKLIVTAAECDAATGESFTKLLTSVCSYTNFPVDITNHQCDFLLDLYSRVKDYETQTGRSFLPALQTVYQSAPAVWNIDLSERKTSLFLEVLKLQTVKKPVLLRGWSDEESEVRSFLQCLPYISQLRFDYEEQRRSAVEFLLKLIVTAAECDAATGESFTKLLTSVCSYTNFPFGDDVPIKSSQCDFLLDLYSHVRDYETQTGRSVLPALQPVYQSAPAVWNIDLSERKTSLFLEVLKLQTVKKPVELRGWSDEESEVRSFLQCLPYISQLSFGHTVFSDIIIKFLVRLLHEAAECEKERGEKTLQLLSSVCRHETFPYKTNTEQRVFLVNLCLQAALHQINTVKTTIDTLIWPLLKTPEEQCDFLLHLYSHVKDYETQTDRSLLPALQPVYQSIPAVWNIDLSERKTSLFLEVLKLQTVKKPVELRGWSDEESEVRSFLQCLSYISQLRFLDDDFLDYDEEQKRSAVEFLLKLIVTAAECDAATGESFTKLLTSVCSYTNFPVDGINYQCDFLLDLYSHVKDYETQTGRSVLPALQPVYQSAPAVWNIDLSKRKTSLFLEVLKLQTVKKPVELRGWSDEESEVRSFLQCLPYISQLRFLYNDDEYLLDYDEEQRRSAVEFLLELIVTAAECDAATGESFTKQLTSVCSYTTFPFDEDDDDVKIVICDFLLDLYSRVKDYETQTGRSVLPALQPVYQSAPAVWNIDLSKRKTSLFIEVLKFQTVKKPVELRGWSDEESEVRSFLQCLPYISQLRFLYNDDDYFLDYDEEQRRSAVEFLLKLIVTAAECDAATGESFTKQLTSVYNYTNFPFDEDDDDVKIVICDFLLDLCSHVKDYETQTGRSVLPALQPVYQSAPAVWNIDLSKRKTSLFLEVLKLHTVKKPVVLRGWSDEESEVRSFLQCLPYISQLRFLYNDDDYFLDYDEEQRRSAVEFLLKLIVTAAECDAATGESFTKQLTSVYNYTNFPFDEDDDDVKIVICDFLLDLCSRVKDYETQTGRSVLPALQPVYQSAPAVWNIDLSKRKTSLFLEVLKLHTVKKPVVLRGWSDEESEVRSFLQCLPYISQLRFLYNDDDYFLDYDEEQRRSAVEFLLKLIVTAAECDAATGESFTKQLTSVYNYTNFPFDEDDDDVKIVICDFLLDLCSRVKDYETQTGRSVLPALQPVYQSAPAVWNIDLSKRKTSLFLEVLKLHTVKKPVVLRGWSDEESEVRSFLQCLPYISQLRFLYDDDDDYFLDYDEEQRRSAVEFLLKLIVTAAECDAATGESFTKLLTSVCSYTNFPVDGINYQCDFLLDLYSRVKDYETQTGRSVLPALQPVYKGAPAVWNIDLSKRKTSLFLEVLKLQTVKKPVVLRGWSDEESEVRSFLQCLPYISQLRFLYDDDDDYFLDYDEEQRRSAVEFLLKLIVTAAECDAATGESFTKLLTSVCSYTNFPVDRTNYQCDFLLDLCSRVKDYETQTGRSVLPALQPVYQSAPAVWYIDLSKRKTSLFLEVLKLQTVKKPVKLRGWSDEESEVRSFLQCLPYISQLRFDYDVLDNKEQRRSAVEFLLNLIVTAAECDAATEESFTKLLTSVCSYTNFPVDDDDVKFDICNFLLDLCSRVKDYETQTGRSFLPALQPVYQSAPAVWNIDLSKRKTSFFLEVLKLQTVKKPVELRGWSDEESEVRSFLQCLPYISQLRFQYCVFYNKQQRRSAVEFLLNLIVTAAECDAATGKSFTKLLTSVYNYINFPVEDDDNYLKVHICDFLLDLYSRVKDYETQTGRSFFPALQPVYQSAPAVWYIDLSERKTSLFLDVLKLQTVKKPVELRGWSDEESEVRSFLQCLPYISQLRFEDYVLHNKEQGSAVEFLLKLIVTAAECDAATGESFTKLLTSVCSYTNFPVEDDDNYLKVDICDFLLDLYSHVKDYETQTGRSFLPALQPVYQSAPAVWNVDLSKRKTSLFLEVLKLQTVKKPVELRGWSEEESEVRSFLQCLPYISQLSGPDPYIPSLCKELQSRDQAGQVSPLLQALDFTLSLGGQLSTPSCRAVGRVLGLSASTLNLTLNPRAISLRGVRLLFTHITRLRTLSVSGAVVVKMVRTLRTVRSPAPVTVEELSLIHTSTQQPEGALSRVLSSLASLLRLWRVQCLNLTDYKMEAQSLTVLLCHHGPLTIRLCEETLRQLTVVVYETQEEELTHCFLQKVGGDLTSCTLTWEVIHYFLHYHSVTVNFRKSDIGQQNPRELLPVLDRLQIRRLSPSCVLSIITEIYQTGSAHCVSSLLSSTENCITLNSRELDSVHCAALCFTLQHCTAVSLSLLFTSIPEGELESIVPLLKHVSHLSVDRLLLLRLLHCCSVSELQQGAAVVLLSALQHRLDFSCSSALDLTEDSHTHTLTLSTEDCRVVSVAIQRAHTHTQLTLHDCEIEEAGVEQLFSIIHTVTLQCSKVVLLQFLSLVRVGSELECVRRAVSLSRALGGKVDLSHTRLDQQACGSLALVLEHSEGLSRLDLSHCQLTDHCLQLLCPQLHKAHVLDLSHNDITDVSAKMIYDTVSTNTNIHTVRLFNNRITDRQVFLSDKRFEIW
ncbi:uncharacterized protein LOC143521618 isoform X7 [Brachyhypopomus gauderio]|uniref:uncharacterized protein LOC143521618 isoform X7 n=1 Tax=Brachyhypopomus gauderio TaxID=698409 RepID=UPI00404265F1